MGWARMARPRPLGAPTISAALGRRVEFVDVSPNAMRGALIDVGLPAWQAEGLLEDDAHYRRGEASAVTYGVQDVAGTDPRNFADFARDYRRQGGRGWWLQRDSNPRFGLERAIRR